MDRKAGSSATDNAYKFDRLPASRHGHHAFDFPHLSALLHSAHHRDCVGVWCDSPRRHVADPSPRLADGAVDHRIHGDYLRSPLRARLDGLNPLETSFVNVRHILILLVATTIVSDSPATSAEKGPIRCES